jgi:hypothetical protein
VFGLGAHEGIRQNVGLKSIVAAPQQQTRRFRVSCAASDRLGLLFYANWDGIGEGLPQVASRVSSAPIAGVSSAVSKFPVGFVSIHASSVH